VGRVPAYAETDGALHRRADVPRQQAGRDPADGERLPCGQTGPERWEIELHFAVAAGHRALDVTRAVRTAVTTAVTAALPDPAPAVFVTTTVSDLS
jgi:hypothetical protein